MTGELSTRELARTRTRFFDLLKSFFLAEPDAECLSRWRGILTSLAGTTVSPRLDRAVTELNRLLATKKLQDIRDEYYDLFVDPYSEHRVPTTASWYLDGRNFGPTLVQLRAFLMETGITREETVEESDDAIAVLLDTMVTLIEEERDPAVGYEAQQRLLASYLHPACSRFAETLAGSPRADFYGACAGFLAGYLEIELGLLAATERPA